MRNYQAKTVDEYIASADEAARPHLSELRRIVMATVSGASESISWGVPFYKYHGLLAGFSAFKRHVSFGFTVPLSDDMRKLLADRGYRTGSKTIQITFEQSVPADVIADIVKARAELNQQNAST